MSTVAAPSGPKPVLQKPPGYRDPNTAAAKPLPPPPRKAPLPPSFRPKQRRRGGGYCRICCCTCCIIFLVILFAAVVAAALVYAVYDPSLPEFHLVSFRVPKLNVSENNDGAYLDADTAARVEVKNRNRKMVWYFEDTEVDVSANNADLNLGSAKVAGLEVKEKEVAELKVETRVKGVALDERQRKRVKGMVQSRGLVPNVEVRSRAGVGTQRWKSGKIGVTLVCGGGTMRQLENGDAPICTVTVLRW